MSKGKYYCTISRDTDKPISEDIEDRCREYSYFFRHYPDPYNHERYETKEECMRNCNTIEEQEKLDKLKEKKRFKNLEEMVTPDIIKTLRKMNDIPILNYQNQMYSKNVLNYDEMRSLYIILNQNDSVGSNRNIFLEDIIKSFNGTFGQPLIIRREEIDDESDMLKIIYIKKRDYEYIYEFLDEEYIKSFITEIELFINTSSQYLVKDIYIRGTGSEIGHHTNMLIKKETKEGELILYFFIYDPTSNIYMNDSRISKRIELYINNIFKKKKHKFFNLSTIYGIQDFEIKNKYARIEVLNMQIDEHFTSINKLMYYIARNISEIHKDMKDLLENLRVNRIIDSYRRFIEEEKIEKTIEMNELLFKFIMFEFFNEINETHILRNDIERVLKLIIYQVLNNVPYRIVEKIIDSFFKIVKDTAYRLHQKVSKKINTLTENMKKILNEYNMDHFDDNCYMWSYYTLILILMNPLISVYDIIKTSLYQSDDKIMIQSKYNYILKQIEKNKDTDNDKMIIESYKDLYDIRNKHEISDVKLIFKPAPEIEYSKIIYQKITNLILINIIYNRLDRKHLLYSVNIIDNSKGIYKKLVPEEVNEVLDEFSFDASPITKESIINKIKVGMNILELNKLILGDNIVLKTHIKKLAELSNADNLDSIKLELHKEYQKDINWLINKM
jgi:hypothetical protein